MPATINKRLHYFNGQFLTEKDFNDEQAYFLDRIRRHSRQLHTIGICEGLKVEIPAGACDAVVRAGTALDREGRLLVLTEDFPVNNPSFARLAGKTVYIVISWQEAESDPAETGDGKTRWDETPAITIIPEGDAEHPADLYIQLARVVVSADSTPTITLDETFNSLLAGTNIRGDVKINSLAFLSGADESLWPVAKADDKGWLNLSGELRVQNADGSVETDGGDLRVHGEGGSLEIGGGSAPFINFIIPHQLKDNVRLVNDASGRLSITASTLAISGDISLSETSSISFGNKTRQMLNLWSNQYGIGVQAGTLYFRTDNHFAWHLRGKHSDGERDSGGGATVMSLTRDGHLGVGTPTPTHRLHVIAQDAVGLFESTGRQAYLRLSANDGFDNRVEITNRGAGRLSLYVGGDDVFNITRERNIGIGTASPIAKLQVVGGAIMPSVGNGPQAGIYFPPNPGGGSGDEAFIRYLVSSGEVMEMAIGCNNDMDDRIAFYQAGAVRMHIVQGRVVINLLQMGDKLTLSSKLAPSLPDLIKPPPPDETWLALLDVNEKQFVGGFAAGKLFSADGKFSGSDAHRKEAVETLSGSLEKVTALRGVRFRWKDRGDEYGPQLGLIAQEVETVLPELVETGPDGLKALNYEGLLAPLVEAIKDLAAENQNLHHRLETLEKLA